jgi:ATP-dependent Clp protease adaptor protein ClpS
MTDVTTKPRTKVRLKPKPERPRLHKVILLNDDYTPRRWAVIITR